MASAAENVRHSSVPSASDQSSTAGTRAASKPRIGLLRRQSSRRMNELLQEVAPENVGLCLSSSGGYHPIAFCAGVLKSLLAEKVRIDHLSTVSGGSALGAAYLDWKMREGGQDSEAWHQRFFKQLLDNLHRAHYDLESRHGRRHILVVAITTLVHLVLSLMVMCAFCFPLLHSMLNQTSWTRGITSVISYVPIISQFLPGDDLEALVRILQLQMVGMVMLLSRPLFTSDSQLSLRRHVLLMGLSMMPFLINMHSTGALLSEGTRLKDLFGQACKELIANTTANGTEASNASATATAVVNITDVPYNPYGCNLLATMIYVAVPGVAFLLSVFVMALFLGTRRSFLIILVTFAMNMTVLWGQTVFEEASLSDVPLFNILVGTLCLVSFYSTPLLLPIHQYTFLRVFEERLRLALFHPSGHYEGHSRFFRHILERIFISPACAHKAESGDDKQSRSPDSLPRDLTFSDVASTKPELIVQLSLQNWRMVVKDPRDDGVIMLSMSSKFVDVINYENPDSVSEYLERMPSLIPISTAMAAGFPGVSLLFTSANKSFEFLREILLLLHPRHSLKIPVWVDSAPGWSTTISRALLVALVHVGVTIDILMFLFAPALAQRLPVGALAFLFRISLACVTLLPSDKDVSHTGSLQQKAVAMSRWLNVHVPMCRYLRCVMNVTNIGAYPDFILDLSSCEDVEHTGLMALLKRQTAKIIVADAGAPVSFNRAEKIMLTLQRARKNLGCRFSTMDDEDLTYELFRTLGSASRGVAPHAIQFKVFYTVKNGDSRDIVGQGEILLVQPHHPDQLLEGDWSGDLDDGWCAGEADELYGALTGKSRNYITRTIGEWYHGKFPYYGRAFHPTAEQTAALFREGERAMSAPAVQQFVEDLGKTTHIGAPLRVASRPTSMISQLSIAEEEEDEEEEAATPAATAAAASDGENSSDEAVASADGMLDMSALGLQQNPASLSGLRQRLFTKFSPVEEGSPPPALPPRGHGDGPPGNEFLPLESPQDVPRRSVDKPSPVNPLTAVAMEPWTSAVPPPLPPKPQGGL
eukprot:scpid28618/ scgid3960/ 